MYNDLRALGLQALFPHFSHSTECLQNFFPTHLLNCLVKSCFFHDNAARLICIDNAARLICIPHCMKEVFLECICTLLCNAFCTTTECE